LAEEEAVPNCPASIHTFRLTFLEPLGMPENKSIRIVVCDASAMTSRLIADGLRRARFEVVDCVATSNDLLVSVRERSVDIALISASLQEGRFSGFHALQQIRVMAPTVRPIMMLDERDPELVISAFRGGAKAVLTRAQPFRTLCKCIRQVSEGQIVAEPADLEAVLEALARTAPLSATNMGPTRPLTKREQEVVTWVQHGYSNREIAQKLYVSEHTVKNHLLRIFEKLGVSNRVELALRSHNAATATN
jgi:two-component system, NarL family, response regulator DegU